MSASSTKRGPSHADAATIAWRGLLTARATLGAAALLGIGWASWARSHQEAAVGWLPSDFRPGPAIAVVIVWGVVSAIEVLRVRARGASDASNGLHLVVDAVALTALLMVTGGVRNPFSTLYFVPLTLATQLSPRWTWAIAAATSAGFASMFVYPGLGAAAAGPHAHHFAGHMRGMWYAFAAAGALMTIFVHRIARALNEQRAELERLRSEQLEARHIGAIGALAAGAAHELGTPLGTVSLLAEELEYLDDAERAEALGTMRVQLRRAKQILLRMRTPAARVEALGEEGAWSLDELRSLADDAAAPADPAWRFAEGAAQARTTLPRASVGQILREILRNAGRAVARLAEPVVEVDVRVDGPRGCVIIEVVDQGGGMDVEAVEAAFEPFDARRGEHAGLGLGLYLTRAHVRALDGQIDLKSKLGEGTRVRVVLPLEFYGGKE